MAKIKINRPFIYKAYMDDQNLLNLTNFSDCKESLTNVKKLKFLFKSECHYYVEKFILDFINNNLIILTESKNIKIKDGAKNIKFLLIKVYDHDLVQDDDQIINFYNFNADDQKINIF